MADVCAEMVFHYNGQFEELVHGKTEISSLTSMQGPSNKVRRFKIGKPFGIFGVYLYPYSIPVFFNIPATELSNQMPDLITLMGKEGAVLEEQIMLAADNTMRVKIITQFLEQRLEKFQKQHPVLSSIRFIIQSKGLVTVEKIADQYFISQRQFERKFKEFSGLTPKLFSRIVRFHAACQHFGNCEKSLTQIAYECGYYDQSHFIHDFKEFSGHHPKLYFSGHAEGTEWRTT
jgi:AraC-like DNA-binding protein